MFEWGEEKQVEKRVNEEKEEDDHYTVVGILVL